MLRKGISLDQAVSRRILNAGFDAIAEYDQSAVLVGTAGALSSGRARAAPQLATASRIAWKVEMASINGGSPTALER